MSKFFSFKLYLQGLKKTRLQGIAIAAIVTAITALIPLSKLLSPRYYEPGYVPSTHIVDYGEFAIPLLLLLVLTPILTLSMFSFLNKRNESDFYHSIPFTRPCTYFSFLASILTWTTATLILALTVNTLLWVMVPYTAVSLMIPLVHFVVYFLAILLLTAFMVVAMTLTGTTISNLLIFALLFSFVRIAGSLFVACLDSQFPIMVLDLTPARFLQIDFNIPLALIGSFGGMGATSVFSNYGLWLYTAVISLALIAAGCVLYTRRRSEMAGQSAPNRILQHIYRCMVTMPMAFLIAYFIIEEGLELETLIVLVVLTLLVYYLYEIITTKRLKNLLSASAFLPVLVAGGVIFGVAVALTGNAALNYTPSADKIKSLSVYNDSEYDNLSYEERNTQAIAIDHPEVLEFISKELVEMRDTAKASDADHYLYPNHYYDEKAPDYYTGALTYYEYETRYCLWTIKITGKSGRVCGRTLCLTDDEYQTLSALFTKTEEYENALLALPTDSEILGVDTNHYSMDSDYIWECFVNEYNALSREEQIAYKTEVICTDWAEYSLNVSGMKGVDRFYSTYPLSRELFPETCKLYVKIMNQSDAAIYSTVLSALDNEDYIMQYMQFSDSDGQSYNFGKLAKDSALIKQVIRYAEEHKDATDETAQIVQLDVDVYAEPNDYYIGTSTHFYLLSEEDIAEILSIMQVDGYVDKTITAE